MVDDLEAQGIVRPVHRSHVEKHVEPERRFETPNGRQDLVRLEAEHDYAM